MRRDDERWMRAALDEARLCVRGGEPHLDDVPIGAVIVRDGVIIARGHNEVILHHDATLHAELVAVRSAIQQLATPRLEGATLYVTLEPCPMCAGAFWLARLGRVVFGAFDLKAGACGSLFDIPRDVRLNHRLEVRGGVLEEECKTLLTDFFATRRENS
ncbi:tRNA-specific adenosine deaminase [Abditibacteriota bacterium]|nr:tRNA-specific adenosine deaminase [Abditibacteriota bacterium]